MQLEKELTPMSSIERSGGFWDFTQCSEIDSHAGAYVMESKPMLFEDFDGVCRSYIWKEDTLYYRGYNIGRLERMRFNDNVPSRSTQHDFFVDTDYSARGNDSYFETGERGRYSSQQLVSGNLVYGIDTIRNVTLWEETIVAAKQYGNDSAAYQTQTTVYKWVDATGIPIAAQINTQEATDDCLSRLFISDFSKLKFERPELFDSYIERSGQNGELERQYAHIMSAEVIANGNIITVCLTNASTPFNVIMGITDSTGNLYYYEEKMIDGPEKISISHASRSGNTCILSIKLSEFPEYERKIYLGI